MLKTPSFWCSGESPGSIFPLRNSRSWLHLSLRQQKKRRRRSKPRLGKGGEPSKRVTAKKKQHWVISEKERGARGWPAELTLRVEGRRTTQCFRLLKDFSFHPFPLSTLAEAAVLSREGTQRSFFKELASQLRIDREGTRQKQGDWLGRPLQIQGRTAAV